MYCAARSASLLKGGSGACSPKNFFFLMVQFGAFSVYLDQILSLKNFKNYYFLYKIFINSHFFNKNLKNYYFLYKK